MHVRGQNWQKRPLAYKMFHVVRCSSAWRAKLSLRDQGLYRGVLPNVQRAALVNLGEFGGQVLLTKYARMYLHPVLPLLWFGVEVFGPFPCPHL